jgi:hypothetical protein
VFFSKMVQNSTFETDGGSSFVDFRLRQVFATCCGVNLAVQHQVLLLFCFFFPASSESRALLQSAPPAA